MLLAWTILCTSPRTAGETIAAAEPGQCEISGMHAIQQKAAQPSTRNVQLTLLFYHAIVPILAIIGIFEGTVRAELNLQKLVTKLSSMTNAATNHTGGSGAGI